jgi:hypothetical protein
MEPIHMSDLGLRELMVLEAEQPSIVVVVLLEEMEE